MRCALPALPCRCSPWPRGRASSSRPTRVTPPPAASTKTKTLSENISWSESPSFPREQTARTPGSSVLRSPRRSQTPRALKWASLGNSVNRDGPIKQVKASERAAYSSVGRGSFLPLYLFFLSRPVRPRIGVLSMGQPKAVPPDQLRT